MLTGEIPFELNSEFEMNFWGDRTVLCKTDYIYMGEELTKFRCVAYKAKPSRLRGAYVISIIKNLDYSCCIKIEFIRENTLLMDDSKAKDWEERTGKWFKILEGCLLNEKMFKFHYAQVDIKADFNLVWSYVSNLKKLHSLVPEICTKVNYQGNIIQEGDKVFIAETEGKPSDKLVVLSADKVKETVDAKSVLYSTESSNCPIPLQQIEWKVKRGEDNNCSVFCVNIYREFLDEKIIQKFTKKKNSILGMFKERIEKLNVDLRYE